MLSPNHAIEIDRSAPQSQEFLFLGGANTYREVDRSPLDITGDKGVARGRIALSGTVFVRGTLWTARQQAGQRVIEDGEAI